MARRIIRWLGIATLVVGYPLLAHYTNVSARASGLGALVAIAPIVLIGFLLAWHSPRRLLMTSVVIASCVALGAAWPLLEGHFDWVYWLQNMGMQFVLFLTFSRTLIDGRQPLCTRFAEALYGPVTPTHARYTRQVTIAWSLFFAAMALASTLFFFLAPLATWSIFANFMTLPLVALMFLAEYGVRKMLLSEMPHMRILDAVRAYKNHSSDSSRTSH